MERLCTGMERAAAASLAPRTVLHLASGVETRIGDFAPEMALIGGYPDYPIESRERRAGEVARNFARYDRAREVLGFDPRWSLAAGPEPAWQWFREQGDAALETAMSNS